jgi:transcriptional regulator with XRE-family HTH domain
MPKKRDFEPDNRLRSLRLERKMSLATVANGCNASIAQIQKLEISERELDYGWMVRLARFYQMEPADLLLSKDGGLTPQERRIIDTLREIPAERREMIEETIENQQAHRQKPEIIELEQRAAS